LVHPYLGRCLNVNDIEQLMEDVTAHYVEDGYIAARVYLGKQDLSSGVLEMTVIEGVLEGLRIEDDGKKSISQPNAFPGMVGKPLNLRDIEQGLDQINRLASNDASMEIEPGKGPGGSVLVMSNEPEKPWHVHAGVDNFGSASTGRNQFSASLTYDNPLGFNDMVSVSDRRTIDRVQGLRDSGSNSVSYTIPFGWTTLATGFSRSTYVSTISPSGVPSRLHGDSTQTYVRADHVVYRDRSYLLNFSGSLTRKETNNYLGENHLDSSRVLAVEDYDLSLRTNAGGGILYLGLGFSEGSKLLGGMKDPDALDITQARAQFQKLRYSASWSRQRPLGERSVDFSTQFNGQYSRDVLYGSEQLLIGGVQSVRGFKDVSLQNDTGWMVRNEVGIRTPMEFAGNAGSWRAYAGLDAGSVRGCQGAGVGGTGNLIGAALGLQTKIGSVSVDAFVMTPLKHPSTLSPVGTSVHGTVSVSF
jgi:hemolysin activation/secretion protein